MSENELVTMLTRIKVAMEIVESLPEDVHPFLDDDIAEAFNALDDAATRLQQELKHHRELVMASEGRNGQPEEIRL